MISSPGLRLKRERRSVSNQNIHLEVGKRTDKELPIINFRKFPLSLKSMIKSISGRLDPSGKIKKQVIRRSFAIKRYAKRRLGLPENPYGVNLVGYIRAEMGLGAAARAIAMALEAASVPFDAINFERGNPSLHRDTTLRHKEVDRAGHDVTILVANPDNAANATALLQEKALSNRYTIGYWFWELPEIPDEWLPAFSLVDEIWAASRFVQDAISLKSPVPVIKVPVPVCLSASHKFSRDSFNLPEQGFLFLSMSDIHSSLYRKNPLGAIRAFKMAFSKDDSNVGLILKINNPNHQQEEIEALRREIGGYQNIHVMDRFMSREEINSLLTITDCFVSLHRSEGFGLGPAEAMSLGKPVIVTNYSGNTDYMTPHNSIGIDYQLIEVGKGEYSFYEYGQQWAEPDIEQASYWMKKLTQEPELARRIGGLAQETIKSEFSPEVVGRLIAKRLKYIKRSS